MTGTIYILMFDGKSFRLNRSKASKIALHGPITMKCYFSLIQTFILQLYAIYTRIPYNTKLLCYIGS